MVDRNALVRSCCGWLNSWSGRGVLDDPACIHHNDAIGHLWANRISWVTTIIVMWSRASSRITARHLADHLDIQRAGRLCRTA